MPIDPSISLKAQTPDMYGAVQQGRQDAYSNQIGAAKVRQIPMQEKLAQMEFAAKRTERALQLTSMANESNYAQVRAQAIQELGPEVESELPPVYDPNAMRNIQMQLMPVRDQIKLEMEKALNEARIGTEGAQSRLYDAKTKDIQTNPGTGSGGGGSPFGNSMAGRAYGILLNGDPSSQEYALAYQEATKPRYQSVIQPDGSTQLVAVAPQLPANIRPPAGMLQPPPMPGTPDSTPTTPQGQLLPNPNQPIRSFTTTPIAGTQGAPKLTEGQSNAALYATRMEESDKIISDLEKSGNFPGVTEKAKASIPVFGNKLVSQDTQSFNQAQRDFVNAVLRRESGAVISEQEFENAKQQYFPQPFDSKATIEQKKRNRQTAIQGIKNAAGPAGRSTGNTQQADPLGIR